jgi:preprotein translocase subunit SecG
MESIILVIHLLVVLSLIVVILIQRSEGGALGMGGGGAGAGLVSVRGSANLLTRATTYLAVVFFVTSMTLSVLAGNRTVPTLDLDAPVPAPVAPIEEQQPAQPGVPLSE